MYSYVVAGIVEKGDQRGTALGFPTANIPLRGVPLSGSYAGTVGLDGKDYAAVLYAEPSRGVLEAHLLDFAGDLYGKPLTISVGAKIRESQRFDSEEALRGAIASDVAAARELSGKMADVSSRDVSKAG